VEKEIDESYGRVGTVILAGGLGENPYLRTRLDNAIGSSVRLIYPPIGYASQLCTMPFVK
jgi:tRNA A37 threonylcarbamoyltransferase TsaD